MLRPLPKNPEECHVIRDEHNFKLVAIRPLSDCSAEILKNLSAGLVYPFYNAYTFYDDTFAPLMANGILRQVAYAEVVPANFFRTQVGNGQLEVDINISAVVGKNGSGKSSLLELLYLSCYILAATDEILPGFKGLHGIINDKLSKEDNVRNAKMDLQELNRNYNSLSVEIYYTIGKDFFSLSISKGKISCNCIPVENQKTEKLIRNIYFNDVNSPDIVEDRICNHFFYSIAINYSLYGLNSWESGSWLDELFHKNDGYRTPLVINPFRTAGKINVHTEFHLAQTRLLSNLLDNDYSPRTILQGKTVSDIEFQVFPFRSVDDKEESPISALNELYLMNYKESLMKFFARLLHDIVGEEVSVKDIKRLEEIQAMDKGAMSFFENGSAYVELFNASSLSRDKLLYLIARYTIRKVFRICKKYDGFKKFIIEVPFVAPVLDNLDDLIKALIADRSHVTLKLKQILNVVKYDLLLTSADLKKWTRREHDFNPELLSFCYKLPVTKLAARIKKLVPDGGRIEEFMPVAFFKPDFYIRSQETEAYRFSHFSSGEQQFIHSIQSVLYHIRNIDSVFHGIADKNKVPYRLVNLILDEVELYYHPEYQRRFVFELIEGIGNLDITQVNGINILFSTHSPFILSDIPHHNVLRLKEGSPQGFTADAITFGANIHSLLANDFFLENGYMGEFAKTRIKKILDHLESGKQKVSGTNKKDILDFIGLIGEPLIRNYLMEVYYSAYPVDLDQEISRLELMKSRIKNGED